MAKRAKAGLDDLLEHPPENPAFDIKGAPAITKGELAVRSVPIDSVTPDPANARLHKDKDLTATGGSLKRFRQQTPIVVDKNGIIRKGNGTWLAAKAAGWKKIAVTVTELEGSEATAYAIADNRTAELSSWDYEALGLQVGALQQENFDIDVLGFDPDDLLNILGASDFGGNVEAGDIEDFKNRKGSFSPTMHFTQVQKEILKQAIGWWRENNEDAPTKDGACLAAICLEFLSDRGVEIDPADLGVEDGDEGDDEGDDDDDEGGEDE